MSPYELVYKLSINVAAKIFQPYENKIETLFIENELSGFHLKITHRIIEITPTGYNDRSMTYEEYIEAFLNK